MSELLCKYCGNPIKVIGKGWKTFARVLETLNTPMHDLNQQSHIYNLEDTLPEANDTFPFHIPCFYKWVYERLKDSKYDPPNTNTILVDPLVSPLVSQDPPIVEDVKTSSVPVVIQNAVTPIKRNTTNDFVLNYYRARIMLNNSPVIITFYSNDSSEDVSRKINAEPIRLNDKLEYCGISLVQKNDMIKVWLFNTVQMLYPTPLNLANIKTQSVDLNDLAIHPSFTSPFVYINGNGKCYHRELCSYLGASRKEIMLHVAQANGYFQCSQCFKPQMPLWILCLIIPILIIVSIAVFL